MLDDIKRLIINDEGATLVEYGLLIILIAFVCFGVVTLLGGKVLTAFTNMNAGMPG